MTFCITVLETFALLRDCHELPARPKSAPRLKKPGHGGKQQMWELRFAWPTPFKMGRRNCPG